MMNIFLTNLGKYNEGELVGEWVELPVTREELSEVFDRIQICHDGKKFFDKGGCPYEEFFITDYETDFDFEIGEYDNLDDLNRIAEQIEDLDDTDKEVFKAALSEGYSFEEALETVENGDYMYFSDCDDMADVAAEYVEETGMLAGVPESVARYFDFEAFGRDLAIEGHFVFLDNGDCIEFLAA